MVSRSFRKILSILITIAFVLNLVIPPSYAQVISQTFLNLPNAGTMLVPTPAFAPAVIRGLMVYPDNPLKFDFVIDRGDVKFSDEEFKTESTKLVRYFLASLTVPEKDMWVNLSPYEKNRIVPENFGQTEMGRDLLAQDYLLKQLTASLMYPENETGKEFWNAVYAKIQERFGFTDIPLDTFNKVWIVPDQASIYEHKKGAFIVKSRLKVMLEQDYVAMANNSQKPVASSPEQTQNTNDYGLQTNGSLTATLQSQMVREIIIPAIEKEVNEGKTFTQLRQIYYSMILASWYKKALKESLLGKVYVDQNKTDGVQIADASENQKIFEKYVEAFKQGAYDYVKEDYNPETQAIVTRKYISGGVALAMTADTSAAMTGEDVANLAKGSIVAVTLDNEANAAMTADQATLAERLKDVPGRLAELIRTNEGKPRAIMTAIAVERVINKIRAQIPYVNSTTLDESSLISLTGFLNKTSLGFKEKVSGNAIGYERREETSVDETGNFGVVIERLFGAVEITLKDNRTSKEYIITVFTTDQDFISDAAMTADREIVTEAIKSSELGSGKPFSTESVRIFLDNVNPQESKRSLGEVRALLDILQGQGIVKQQRGQSDMWEKGNVGGIDFNPENLKMKVNKKEGGVEFMPVTDAMIQNIDIKGFVPVIINVTPATNLPMLLGIVAPNDKKDIAKSG